MPSACLVCAAAADFEEVAPSVRDSDLHRVVRCLACGRVQLDPIPTPEEDKGFYDHLRQQRNIRDDVDVDRQWHKRRWDTVRRLELIRGVLPRGGRLLEIGCGYGFFLREARRAGFDVVGLEISAGLRQLAQGVVQAPILDVDLQADGAELAGFELVALFHVLEHVRDPVGFLRAAAGCLSPGGLLVVEVPNLDDALLASCRAYRDFWWQRAHFSYFSPGTLEAALRRAGVHESELRGVQRYGIENWSTWMATGRPQIDAPSHETEGPYAWLEASYKEHLVRALQSDTLIALASV